ncbi:hypothetical protein Anas_12270 [Armadillidium nasatum]|uniref:Uncharacterized protein n=1 Tax=Armadillidium nasatum TaxID=96803 RepID=A0A5N5T636_9CRUS|nr:hypothetical protein Anas_12270 [Armadillidium nasatum]
MNKDERSLSYLLPCFFDLKYSLVYYFPGILRISPEMWNAIGVTTGFQFHLSTHRYFFPQPCCRLWKPLAK